MDAVILMVIAGLLIWGWAIAENGGWDDWD